MKAIVVGEPGSASVQNVNVPRLRPDYVKVKVKAVALNPTDWKHIDKIADFGAISGCDFAGTVEEVGLEVKKVVMVGDRICGFVHGGNLSNHEDGCFAEYCVVKDGLFMHIPDGMSFEAGASLGLGVGTVGQGLFQSLRLPAPNGPKLKAPFPLLIYGGSTATGTLAIQFGALSGLKVVTTASPKNHEFLQSLGADKCFDYNDPDCAEKVREYTGNTLRYAFDTIASEDSIKICAGALSSSHDHGELNYSALLGVKKFPRDDVNFRYTMLYTAVGEEYTKMKRTQKPKPEDYEFIKSWFLTAENLIAEKKIKPHPIEVGEGLEGVLEGLNRMRKGDYNSKKFVYVIG